MKRTIAIFAVSLLIAGSLFANGMRHQGPENPQYYKFMVFRMTEELQLSPEQAERFFPLLREYHDKKHALHMEKAELSEKAYAQENIGESDLVRYKDEVKRLELAEVDADMKFYAELEGFLRPGQVVRFIFFEHQFRREMSMELKKRYNKPEERKGFWQRRQK